MKTCFIILLCISAMAMAQEPKTQVFNSKIKGDGYTLYFDKGDGSQPNVQNYLNSGIKGISAFFNKEFKKEIDVHLFHTRKKLDAQWQKDWGMPGFKSECWMVGSGIASRLDLLSPSVWKKEACEHDPEDQVEIKRLVFHELTHVLHSDYNRSPNFDDIDNIDWFVEGLATYASGQLDEDRFNPMAKYVIETGGPKQLSEFWKGEHRYGLSGSIVAYIDKTYGRRTLSELMEFNHLVDILNRLNLSEVELIEAWKGSVVKGK